MKKRGRIYLDHEPITDVIAVFRRLHPDKSVRIRIDTIEQWDKLGETFWADEQAIPVITVRPDIAYSQVVDTLIHELAHVVAGHAAHHGRRWATICNALHRAYARELRRRA